MTIGTLRDIAAKNGADKTIGIIDEVAGSFPEIMVLTGRTINGTAYKATLRRNNPKGSFRAANAGVTPGAAGYYEKWIQTFIFENPIIVDKRVAEADEDGADSYLADRSIEHVAGALEGLAEQFYYGEDSEDSKGFIGLKALASEEVSATGSTAANATTVYLVRNAPDAVQFVYGRGAGLAVPAFTEQMMTDPADSTKILPAYVSPMGLWIGLQANHPKSIVKITNVTTDSGKGLTDALIQHALEKMPAGFRNDKASLMILANARSVGQLQTSRTAVSQVAYKSGAIADRPTESLGIKIVETDSIRIGATEAE